MPNILNKIVLSKRLPAPAALEQEDIPTQSEQTTWPIQCAEGMLRG